MSEHKEIDGVIYKMLLTPKQLTMGSTFPCLIKLIDDDSEIGETNKKMVSKYTLACEHVASGMDESGYLEHKCTGCFCTLYHSSLYNIVGEPLKQGGQDWAVYQMLQGGKIRPSSWIKDSGYYSIVDGMVEFNNGSASLPKDRLTIKEWVASSKDREDLELYSNYKFKVNNWIEYPNDIGSLYQITVIEGEYYKHRRAGKRKSEVGYYKLNDLNPDWLTDIYPFLFGLNIGDQCFCPLHGDCFIDGFNDGETYPVIIKTQDGLLTSCHYNGKFTSMDSHPLYFKTYKRFMEYWAEWGLRNFKNEKD